jgi:hypothetical protein
LGLSFFVRKLEKGQLLGDVRTLIMGSPEYFASRAGRSHEDFLTALTRDLLGREPAPTDQFVFNAALVPGGQLLGRAVPESGRPGPGSGLARKRLQTDPTGLGLDFAPESLPSAFDAAAAATRRRTRLRSVTAAELRRALQRGLSRNTVAAVYIFSQERARRFVDQAFGRFLRGVPIPSLRELYAAALVSGVPEDVINAAVMGSDDYLLIRNIGPTPAPDGGFPDIPL